MGIHVSVGSVSFIIRNPCFRKDTMLGTKGNYPIYEVQALVLKAHYLVLRQIQRVLQNYLEQE